jgi:kynureninase
MELGIDYAEKLDSQDEFRKFRSYFHMPKHKDGTDEIYLCGNSLGLQPKSTTKILEEEMNKWALKGVKGHFEGERPWMPFHKFLLSDLSKIVGANETEVVAMNSLTANLHFLMVSFYRPTQKRHKIIIEEHAFPSDHYAVESQIKFHGFDPNSSMILLKPEEGEETLRHEKIIEAIREHGDELALVMLPGVQYYTGQVFKMEEITKCSHEVGASVGFDLAHAVGNVELDLHGWGVDFAVWCHYKYLNSGPGSVGGCFVHKSHCENLSLPRFAGWWGHNQETRFKMENNFDPMPTAEGWQLSNPPIVSLACIKASLEIFTEAGGVRSLRKKAVKQFEYLDYLLMSKLEGKVEVISPKNIEERGCQHSIKINIEGLDSKKVFNEIEERGVSCDFRHPNVIRIAHAPLYNSYSDLFKFVEILATVVEEN